MKTGIKNILSIILLLCICTSAYSQTLKAQLTVEHKQTIKQLKKEHKLKGVEVIVEPDGYWYFSLRGKKNKYGIATKEAKVIVPAEYELGTIEYYPAMKKGFNKVNSYDQKKIEWLEKKCMEKYMADMSQPTYPERWRYKRDTIAKMKVYTHETPAFFIARGKDQIKIVTDKGVEPVKLLPGEDAQAYSGYIVVGARTLFVPIASRVTDKYFINTFGASGRNISLYTANGDCLVKGYFSVYIKENGVCTCGVIKGVERTVGAFLLDNPGDSIPCKFNGIMYDRYSKKWKVQKTSNGTYEEYTPEMLTASRYRDKGEECYEKSDFDGVIKFYSEEGVAAPWAKFFTGMAMYRKANLHTVRCENTCNALLQNKPLPVGKFDLEEAEKQLELSKALLEAYIAQDSTYLDRAKMFLKFANEKIDKMYYYQHRYKLALEHAEERKNAAALAELRQQEEMQQQLQQTMNRMMNSIFQSLQGTSGSSKRSVSSRFTGGYSSGVGSGSGSGTGSAVSNESSSQRDNTDQQIYWERKKRDTEKLIENTRERLAKDPGNSRIKRQLESQEELLKTCNETLSRMNNR